jgi:hypothetical protein
MAPIAYIDPGAGSLIWQSITAALIGCSFYLRRFFNKARKKAKDKRTQS